MTAISTNNIKEEKKVEDGVHTTTGSKGEGAVPVVEKDDHLDENNNNNEDDDDDDAEDDVAQNDENAASANKKKKKIRNSLKPRSK